MPEKKNNSLLISIIIFVLIIVVLKAFVIDFYHIESNSMSPGLVTGDNVIILKKYCLNFRNLKGKVVAFESPYDNTTLVKRYVAGAGEPFSKFELYGNMQAYRDFKLIEGEFFAIGDNKAISLDSRYFGAIKEEAIQ